MMSDGDYTVALEQKNLYTSESQMRLRVVSMQHGAIRLFFLEARYSAETPIFQSPQGHLLVP